MTMTVCKEKVSSKVEITKEFSKPAQ